MEGWCGAGGGAGPHFRRLLLEGGKYVEEEMLVGHRPEHFGLRGRAGNRKILPQQTKQTSIFGDEIAWRAYHFLCQVQAVGVSRHLVTGQRFLVRLVEGAGLVLRGRMRAFLHIGAGVGASHRQIRCGERDSYFVSLEASFTFMFVDFYLPFPGLLPVDVSTRSGSVLHWLW